MYCVDIVSIVAHLNMRQGLVKVVFRLVISDVLTNLNHMIYTSMQIRTVDYRTLHKFLTK